MNQFALFHPALLSLAQEVPSAFKNNPDFFWALVVLGLFIFGLVLFFLEVFVIPGVGVAALLSFAAIVGSIVICFYKFSPLISLAFFMISLIVVSGMMFWVVAIFPKTRFSDGIIHKGKMESGKNMGSVPDYSDLLGQEGEVILECRPVGKARFGNRKVDVTADGQMLAKGTRIRVTQVEGNDIRVEEVSS